MGKKTMNQNEKMRRALEEIANTVEEVGWYQEIAEKALASEPDHIPDAAKMVEPTPKKFVQSDKGRVAVVINKGANGRLPYGIVIEESVHHSNPILIADFVQEKDALLFAKIWNKETPKTEHDSDGLLKKAGIDRKTAIRWAKDVGFVGGEFTMVATIEEVQALILRAQNEAYEEAAQRADARRYMSENFADLADELRTLKG